MPSSGRERVRFQLFSTGSTLTTLHLLSSLCPVAETLAPGAAGSLARPPKRCLALHGGGADRRGSLRLDRTPHDSDNHLGTKIACRPPTVWVIEQALDEAFRAPLRKHVRP